VFLFYRILIAFLWIGVAPRDRNQATTIARLPITTRAEIIARAKTFAEHTWTCGASNLRAPCSKNYRSDWKPGQVVTGIPYNWGGFDGPKSFDLKIA
jgi:hypothetical protein